MEDPEGYRPREYWSRRLESEFTLRSTGHQSYSASYNAWLYRAKDRALRRALAGLPPPAPGRALDIGSGTGWVVAELLRRGIRTEGCDLTEISVRRLALRFPGTDFFQVAWGAEPLPRPDASFDLVTLLDVAYHVVDDEQWAAGLAEAARVLVPGGHLVVTDRFGSVGGDPAEHVRFRSARRWREAAARAGLVLGAVHPYVRWLSRDRRATPFDRLPDGLRGALEYGLDRVAPGPAHLRFGVLHRRSTGPRS